MTCTARIQAPQKILSVPMQPTITTLAILSKLPISRTNLFKDAVGKLSIWYQNYSRYLNEAGIAPH